MPQLMRQLLARYMSPAGEDGSDTGGTSVQISDSELSEHGLTREEFAALPEDEQKMLAADTPDDTKAHSDEEAAALNAQREAKLAESTPEPTATPTPTPAAPTPTPTPAPKEEPGSHLPTPQPTAQPTPQPTAAPGQWTQAPADEADPLEPPPRLAPADAEAQRTTLKDQKEALWTKFDSGELSTEEYRAQLRPIEDKLETLGQDIAADRAAQALYERDVTKRWTQMVNATIGEIATASGLDLQAETSKPVMAELDAAVRRYGQAGPLMHPGKSALWYDKWALEQAKTEVAGKHGWTVTGAPPAATSAPRREPPDLSQIPPTLRGAPPAGDPNISAGEFAHLDSLSMSEQEKAVALMSPEQQDRWLSR